MSDRISACPKSYPKNCHIKNIFRNKHRIALNSINDSSKICLLINENIWSIRPRMAQFYHKKTEKEAEIRGGDAPRLNILPSSLLIKILAWILLLSCSWFGAKFMRSYFDFNRSSCLAKNLKVSKTWVNLTHHPSLSI